MLSGDEKRRLAATTNALPVTLQVGKGGASEGIVNELDSRLELEKLVKVRFLAAARGRDDRRIMAERLAEGTGAELVELRGNTAVFFRNRRRQATGGPQ